MTNTYPPWAAYRSIVAGRLIGLDKCPGVWPVGIGEILQRILGKCVLQACGEDETHACGVDQLCSGLRCGIEGSIHVMTSLWEKHQEEVGWGVLLVDERNNLNEINQTVMLCHV